MTEFEKYFTGIADGKIVACEKMKKAADILMEQYHSPGEYHFDPDIANHHVNFIEKFCKIPSGKIGAPLKLELFQKARLQALFGFVDDNNLRQYNECLIMEGRKNGKTTELAAVETDLLVNDKEGAPQIYNVATMRDQAMLGFTACHKMIKQSPFLSKHIKKRASDLYFSTNMGFIKALASNTNSLDGLDVHAGIIDELAAIKNRDIYDLVKQAMAARRQPLLFCITTNGFIRNGIFDTQYEYASGVLDGKIKDDKFLPFIYELDSLDEWDKEECWIKANPGLGTIKSYDFLRRNVQKAKDDPAFKPTVLVKDFNMKQNAESAWLRWEEIDNQEFIGDKRFRYGIGGMDAADSVDLNAAKDYVPNASQTDRITDRIYSFFNTNKHIVQSDWNEDQWTAYYEAEIEPVAIQFGNELTTKLFSSRERGCGNYITYESSNLQCASMNTKLAFQAMVDRGAMLPNEWRAILNLAQIEGGDKPIRRLDTQVVDMLERMLNKMNGENFREMAALMGQVLKSAYIDAGGGEKKVETQN